jgi:ankyrin repeat protein
MLMIVLLVGALAWSAGVAVQHDRANQALIAAVNRSHATAAIAALDAGADPNARDDGGLFPATWRHLRARLERLTGQDASEDEADEPTALIGALEPRMDPKTDIAEDTPENVALVKALLDRGADVNIQDLDGDTPLMLAAWCGYTETALLLLAQGASVNGVAGGEHPGKALAAASEWGDRRLVELLLAKGANVNLRGDGGCTPLMCAAEQGHPGIAKRLLQVGAQVDARNDRGQTALMEAAEESGEADAAKALLDAGAEVNVRDADGDSALTLAVRERHSGVVRLLKKAGAR